MKVLITGSTGFLGRYVISQLEKEGHLLSLQGASRTPAEGAGRRTFKTGPFETFDGWPELLDGIDTVVNLAGRSRISSETEEAYRAANETAMLRLVDAMQQNGVARLVHVSSIAAKVVADDYGRTKLTGEKVIANWAEKPGNSAVILRPPLIYGPGAPGNMAKLVRLVRSGLPLPIGSVDNRRSLLAAANAAQAIAATVNASPRQGAAIHELCDDEIVSLPEIVRAIAGGMGRRPMLLPFPQSLLHAAASRASPQMAEGLFGSLVLDSSPFKAAFGWKPAIDTLEGLREMGRSSLT